MDGQVKEARVEQLQALDLHPVDEAVGPRILDELQKFIDDSDYAWSGECMTSLSSFNPGTKRNGKDQQGISVVVIVAYFEGLRATEFMALQL